MRTKSFYLLSLGCSKNLVDSESIYQLLNTDGYIPVDRPSQAEILIVNTCAFIKTARDESLLELKNLADNKQNWQYLIAAGCMTERHRQVIIDNVNGIDGFVGTSQWMDILELIKIIREMNTPGQLYHLPDTTLKHVDVLRGAIQGPSAYLKIADGCRRSCSYCAIPLIKGTSVSLSLEKAIHDAKELANRNVQELNLIAQDTTDYGFDLGMKDGLVKLLKRLTLEVPEIPWIRILYSYPGCISDDFIELMASEKQILHYLDLPLQHAHPNILKSMKRPSSIEWVKKTIAKFRAYIPDIALRTTYIVGYPGETEEIFKFLLDFTEEIGFDHVGVFPFSFEPGTTSEKLGDPISPEIKEERIGRLMLLQEKISLSRNKALIGKTLPVLVEGVDRRKNISIGRSYRDAPEIDGLVFINGSLEVGRIHPIRVTGAITHDLIGDSAPLA